MCRCFFFALLMRALLNGDEYSSQIYSQIEDIYHPTEQNFRLIQEYLEHGTRPLVSRLDAWQYQEKARNFRLLGRNESEKIESGIIPVNCDENWKENCILLYSSFNYAYPECTKKLIDLIRNSDFKGHILYRIGGWPDIEGGNLVLAHIPFAFKICFFSEAQRLGYKHALWLDTSVVPINGLNDTFQTIAQQGYFCFITNFPLQNYSNREAIAAMGVTYDEASQIPLYVAGLIGFNFDNALAQKALNLWYEITAYREEASYSARQELCIISSILHRLGMTHCSYYADKITWDRNEIGNHKFDFLVDKLAVQPNWPY